jgi:hypothetical protein
MSFSLKDGENGESMEVDMDVGDWLDSLLPSAQNTIR